MNDALFTEKPLTTPNGGQVGQHPLVRLPRFHDFLAAGVGEKQALAWHEAIQCLKSHARNMAERIEEYNGPHQSQRAAAVHFRTAYGPISEVNVHVDSGLKALDVPQLVRATDSGDDSIGLDESCDRVEGSHDSINNDENPCNKEDQEQPPSEEESGVVPLRRRNSECARILHRSWMMSR